MEKDFLDRHPETVVLLIPFMGLLMMACCWNPPWGLVSVVAVLWGAVILAGLMEGK